jgi:hypothetical protein
MVSSALSVPATDGENFTLMTQEPPPAIKEWPTQLSVSEKSEAFVPDMVSVETLFCKEPRLLRITESAEDDPTGVGVNTRGLGKATAPAPDSCTRPATARTRILSNTTKSPEAFVPAAPGLSKMALKAGPLSPANPQ